mmetsp:Transcript_6308/g.11209  ORF Transcript_6308/g.11209 Transcript_6308/m.11209 type:complete len:511 (-) Transcript_6308:72-1604(-)|eukprot:CAMPEP_0184549610 /NCGR_PEP_ID=MMETSP0199_2-20130426/11213_1 /TAXON_ID=1112570 /ORGANISM="Thraustochytrium sp., Strain LLF1b" /LENGTH=510 /DNA_ID=CAMNT_0026944349 /DNA_START=248 /DNA_END=1780 /DNA_ORIENTATION=+
MEFGSDSSTSSSSVGKEVLGAVLERLGKSEAAQAVRTERAWREKYVNHFIEVQRALLESADGCQIAAEYGLEQIYSHMHWNGRPLKDLVAKEAPEIEVGIIQGEGTHASFELPVPIESAATTATSSDYWGNIQRLTKPEDIVTEVQRMVEKGMCEANVADSIRALLQEGTSGLDLSDQWFVNLGACSEMGSTKTLLSLGANVVAIELARNTAGWASLSDFARTTPGRLVFPVRDGIPGADVVQDLDKLIWWIHERAVPQDKRIIVGSYLYLDGANFVRVAAASDALFARVLELRSNTILTTLCTPTEAFCVPSEAAAAGATKFAARPIFEQVMGMVPGVLEPNVPEKVGKQGRLLQDCYTPEQGPNYAMAKLLQRFRSIASGPHRVISNVAPASLTKSVMSVTLVRVGILGCERFGIIPFLPETANQLMTALLLQEVRALDNGTSRKVALFDEHPMLSFQQSSVHGGTWNAAFKTSSTTKVSVVVFGMNKLNSPKVQAAALVGSVLASKL